MQSSNKGVKFMLVHHFKDSSWFCEDSGEVWGIFIQLGGKGWRYIQSPVRLIRRGEDDQYGWALNEGWMDGGRLQLLGAQHMLPKIVWNLGYLRGMGAFLFPLLFLLVGQIVKSARDILTEKVRLTFLHMGSPHTWQFQRQKRKMVYETFWASDGVRRLGTQNVTAGRTPAQ